MKVRIDIPHHPYDIQIEKGCLAQAGQWLRELWQPQKVVIVTDNHVASLYAEKVKLSLEDAGFQVAVFDFLEGEERKNLTTVQKVYEFLVKQGLTRSDGILLSVERRVSILLLLKIWWELLHNQMGF